MAKYRGLAPWALGVAVVAHACAGATSLLVSDDEAHSTVESFIDRTLTPDEPAVAVVEHEPTR